MDQTALISLFGPDSDLSINPVKVWINYCIDKKISETQMMDNLNFIEEMVVGSQDEIGTYMGIKRFLKLRELYPNVYEYVSNKVNDWKNLQLKQES